MRLPWRPWPHFKFMINALTPHWLDQALELMEEKNFTLEGGVGMGGAVRGDVALVDMAVSDGERKLMRRKQQEEEVSSAAGSAVETSSGVSDKDLWEQAVLRGVKRITTGEMMVWMSVV